MDASHNREWEQEWKLRQSGKNGVGGMKLFRRFFFLCLIFGCLVPYTAFAQDEPEPGEPVVQAILFFSPTCPHCHHVIMNILPPLMDQYGDQLQIMGLDTSYEVGQHLYQTAVIKFLVPQNRLGVPTLIVGNAVLVGNLEIAEQLPLLIESGLADGGIDWPDIPGLKELVSEPTSSNQPAAEQEELDLPGTAEPTPAPIVTPIQETAVLAIDEIDIDQLAATESVALPADPVGFALGWAVLLGLLTGLTYGIWRWLKRRPFAMAVTELANRNNRPTSLILGLVAIGLTVAGYLAYVETTQVTAVCGPIGECNIVQSSPYARIFGVPVAIFGVLSYLTIGVLWLLQRPLGEKVPGLDAYGLLALTLFGTIFSIYLTLLELLVIHAICAWCLTSAVVTLMLFLVVVKWLTERPSYSQSRLV